MVGNSYELDELLPTDFLINSVLNTAEFHEFSVKYVQNNQSPKSIAQYINQLMFSLQDKQNVKTYCPDSHWQSPSQARSSKMLSGQRQLE